MSIVSELVSNFVALFGDSKDTRTFFSPGRVNLIGEHTDYNGGFVFPCALTFGTYAVCRKRSDDLVRLSSNNFKKYGVVEFSINDLNYEEKHDWANYPKGVMSVFKQNNFKIDSGMEILFFGNIPNGAGLSSSASIELATCVILKGLFNLDVDMITMVKMSQRAENEFMGVNCGIMDQFAIGMGKENNAILLDCNSLNFKYANIELKDQSIVIANTNKRRGLADSKYNERRSECEHALLELQSELKIGALGELSEEDFEANKNLIKSEIERKRAKHAVYENARTLKAVKALEEGDLATFGKLMNASHVSLRDDYEVTGIELDTLVELAWNAKGTVGARMTGAGFGGCTVSIVENEYVESFIEEVGNKYKDIIGYEASFYVANVGDGARELI